MVITKELVAKLSSDDITKKEYDQIVGAINSKVGEIWVFICEASKRKLDWWAFDNDVSYGRGNGSSGGEFDPKSHAEFISIIGDNKEFNCDEDPHFCYLLGDGFPTSYLWEDYKTLVYGHLEEVRKKAKAYHSSKVNKAALKKEKRQKLIDSVKAKLSNEELSVITFKKA